MEPVTDTQTQLTRQILSEIFGGFDREDYGVRLWDGSIWQPPSSIDRLHPSFMMVLNHPGSLRTMFGNPSPVNLGEAFLSGSFDIEGDLFSACELGDHLMRLQPSLRKKIKLALQIHSLPKEPAASEEFSRAHLSGSVGSRDRLRAAIAYHYDLPVNFWKLWLDPALLYSCAYFKSDGESLDQAQLNKLDYVCRKLFLSKGERLLDLGCGWGALVIFAAQYYGVNVTGITLSRSQAEYGVRRIKELGLEEQCEIRHLDFRDYECGEQYDKIACVGAVEHVPLGQLHEFFSLANRLLKPGGLFLNHGITESATERHPTGESFVDAYIFPDNGVTTISSQLVAAEETGFEIRDVECLREHYLRTCLEWLKRIEENKAALTAQSSASTQRRFRLYVGAQAYYFSRGASSIHQTLLAKTESKPLNLPLTRAGWYRGDENPISQYREDLGY
jgi:cyclopropane-fatty-acyl-phospholipid synthase